MRIFLLSAVVLLTAFTEFSLAQLSCPPEACCFPYTTSRRISGHVCNVVIPARDICKRNPCRSNEYCQVVFGRVMCCTMESRQTGTAFTNTGESVRCERRCLVPRSLPSYSETVCPLRRPQPPGTEPPRPQPPRTEPPRPQRPRTLPPKPQPPKPRPTEPRRILPTRLPRPTYSCPMKIKNGSYRKAGALVIYSCNEGFRLVGTQTTICFGGTTSVAPPKCACDPPVCSFYYRTEGMDCRVDLTQNQLCPYNPCKRDEYCKLVNRRLLCCKEEYYRLATAEGINRMGCRERCLVPSPPLSSRYPVCPVPMKRGSCPTDQSSTGELMTETPTFPEEITTETPTPPKEITTETPTPPSCPSLENPSNGAVEVSDTTATYSCNEGFYLKPKKSSVRQCVEGQWAGKNPRCAPRKECTTFESCEKKVCVKGKTYCSKAVCSEGQYCRKKNGVKQCCAVVKQLNSNKCVTRCNSAPTQAPSK